MNHLSHNGSLVNCHTPDGLHMDNRLHMVNCHTPEEEEEGTQIRL